MKTETETEKCVYIISEYRKDKKQTWYVSAPPGYYRSLAGEIKRDDPHSPIKGGPEHSTNRSDAYIFKSHRSAARVANLCPSAKIHPILP